MIRPFPAAALLVTLVALHGCGSSSSSPNNPNTPSADVVITINGQNGGMSFSPAAATLRAGQTVAWRNADNLGHDATADGGAFDSRFIGAGQSSTPITMSTAGTFPYHCSIHPTMVATLTVQ